MLVASIVVGCLVLLWSALGCYALRDFAYSRLEDLCERMGREERFRDVLRRQEMAQLVLETLLTLSTIWVGISVFLRLHTEGVSAVPANLILWGALAFLGITLLADLIPWTVSRIASEWFLYHSWPVISILVSIAAPLLWGARQVDRLAHRLVGRGEPEEDDAALIDEEIRTVVDEGQREGLLGTNEGKMIQRVMELQDEDVRAIMTPRTEMLCLNVESSLEDARRQLVEWGHSRLPVIGDSTDEILGILYAKDLLQALGPKLPEGQFVILRDLLREPLYIPITTEIPSLLELMKRRKVQLAIVHDEYGGVAGLVTMEDILEEIVGEIADEFDDDELPEQGLQQIADGVFDVDAGLRREPIREGCGLELPDDDEYETIGGFVFSQLGRLPTPGESIDWEGWRFVVLEVDRRRISRLRIERIQAPADIESSSTGDSTES